jgi:hypothetical protein
MFSREDLTAAFLRLFAIWLFVDFCAVMPATLANWYIWSATEGLRTTAFTASSFAALSIRAVIAVLLWLLSRPLARRVWQGAHHSPPLFDLPGAQPVCALLLASFGLYLLLTAFPEAGALATLLYSRTTSASAHEAHFFGFNARVLATFLQIVLGGIFAFAARPLSTRMLTTAAHQRPDA